MRPAETFDAGDVLAKTRAAYAALGTYGDTGTVLDEATGFTDQSTFRTLFTRARQHLSIVHRGVASECQNGHRLPLNNRTMSWLESGDLHTWSSKTQAHETYPTDGRQQVKARAHAAVATAGGAVPIPSQLYGKSAMPSAVHATDEPAADGFEAINGRRCFRTIGVERWHHPSGRETGVRWITIWIDAETYLIPKIVQDTPKSMPPSAISQRGTTLKHQPNPEARPGAVPL